MSTGFTKNLGEFFRQEYGRMVGFVRSLIDDAADRDGEDIVQDVMTRIFETADISRPIENLAAFVYRSLRNGVIDALRGRRETLSLDQTGGDREMVPSLGELLMDFRYDAASQTARKDMRDALFSAMDSLPAEQREIILMTEFESRSFREIAERTGTPIGTLLARKSRGLARIKKIMIEFDDYRED